MDSLHRIESQIDYEEGTSDEYVISRLEIVSPGGVTRIKEADVVIKPGARVVMVGEPAAARRCCFAPLLASGPGARARDAT